ncbi:uncharacterized protein [Haliotis cracherodii]|uniref:uncharacterized protein n=1 Tax=Haliotis cracherodii TaxID=6455 RepID=UPI0039E7C6E3
MRIVCILVALLCCGFISEIDGVCRCRRGCRRNPAGRCYGYPNKCHDGWSGTYCQRKNVALGGRTAQNDYYSVVLSSDSVVDGNTNTANGYQCALTGDSNNAWWNVRLSSNGVNQIKYMTIYSRDYRPERRSQMEILVDGRQCYQFPAWDIPEVVESITCNETLTGDVVTIRVPGSHLPLCEVEVYVCSDYWFGMNCNQQCHCGDRAEICDKGTGECQSGCAPGFQGTNCQ